MPDRQKALSISWHGPPKANFVEDRSVRGKVQYLDSLPVCGVFRCSAENGGGGKKILIIIVKTPFLILILNEGFHNNNNNSRIK